MGPCSRGPGRAGGLGTYMAKLLANPSATARQRSIAENAGHVRETGESLGRENRYRGDIYSDT